MSEIKVSQVGSRADRNAFIRFPWGIYDNDPAWVPPLIIERKAFLDRKRHPFYRHGDAALFLARQNAEDRGPDHGERRSKLQCRASLKCRLLWPV